MTVAFLRPFLLTFFLLLLTPAWAGEALWIDVRTAGEYAGGHVEGAVNIPYDVILDRIGEVTADKNEPIYVYCRSGRRSGIAKTALESAGYSQVVNLGGYEEAMKKASGAEVDD